MIGSPLIIAEQARARMQAVLGKLGRGEDISGNGTVAPRPQLREADLIITSCEVTPAHGTGTLLLRIFPDSSEIVSLRSCNFYDGVQSFGSGQYCLPMAHFSWPEIVSWVKWCIAGIRIRRIMVLPYLPVDPLIALAAHEITGAPLCCYIMDDKNVCDVGIDDTLLARLLQASGLRLVISPEMRDRYSEKYQRDFYVVPPLVPESLLKLTPVFPPAGTNPARGILLGNIWGQRWLDLLRASLRGSGFVVDWYCNQKQPAGLTFDKAEMAGDGIVFNDPVPDNALPKLLARYPFALVPTDPLDGTSPPSVQAIAELSLPSRIPTMVSMAHLPILIVGSADTCAARFVRRFGLGQVADYQRPAITAALGRLNDPAEQTAIRHRAAELAGALSARDSAQWIWGSLERGGPLDLRYEKLMVAEPVS